MSNSAQPEPESSTLESLLKRDRIVIAGALTALTLLCWAYLVWMAAAMSDMPDSMGDAMAMTQIPEWNAAYFFMMFTMWAIMMVGMMVPSAAPMILLFTTVNRKRQEQGQSYVPTAAFVAGYLTIWTLFSLAATLLQWGLDEAALLSPMMVSTSPLLGGGLLIAAGVYQMTPLKQVCLKHCRSPLQFVITNWRNGTRGALRMGIDHGAFCLGCCWILMGLLFFGGVMNLIWIAAIAIFVLLEKIAPLGDKAGMISGVPMVIIGLAILFRG